MRVKEFRQRLSRELGSDCQLIEHVWLFNTFRLRELQEIAAEEASASDLVIISTYRAGTLPDEVKGWIDLWLQQRASQPAILLTLLDTDYEGASNAVEAYLQKAARQGSMEFLVGSGRRRTSAGRRGELRWPPGEACATPYPPGAVLLVFH